MKVTLSYPNAYFTIDLDKIDINSNYYRGIFGTEAASTIYNLVRNGISVENNQSRTIVTTNGRTWNFEGREYYSILTALQEIKNKKPFKNGKMYRFVYNGGTRFGMKRAVKVSEVGPDYIVSVDLDTGDTKRYNMDKMSAVEEIN